jgi:hypothetical protein
MAPFLMEIDRRGRGGRGTGSEAGAAVPGPPPGAARNPARGSAQAACTIATSRQTKGNGALPSLHAPPRKAVAQKPDLHDQNNQGPAAWPRQFAGIRGR